MKNQLMAVWAAKRSPSAFFQKTFSQFLAIALFAFFAIGWSSCSGGDEPDPCNGMDCLNGGTLQPNCDCQCPLWYEGIRCEKQVTPSYIKVEEVRLLKFPELRPDGTQWDPNGTLPDPWVSIRREDGLVYDQFRTSAIISASQGSTYELPIDKGENFGSVFETYTLYVWDCDSSTDCFGNFEEMGQLDFVFYDVENGFPNPLTLTNADGSIQVELDLQYIPN